MFPISDYKHTFRVKDTRNFSHNAASRDDIKSIADLVGIRVVPNNTKLFLNMLVKFEEKFQKEASFKLNTFAYSEKEIVNKIGKYSVYYRAVHYYFLIDNFYAEVQLRTPDIDQWSTLHHDTIYKPKIPVSDEQKRRIMRFGKISNIVDYFDLIRYSSVRFKKYG